MGEITAGDKKTVPGMAPGVHPSFNVLANQCMETVEPQFNRVRSYNATIRTSSTYMRFLNHCLRQDTLPLFTYGLSPIPGYFTYGTLENKGLTGFHVEQGRELLRFLKGLFTDQRKRVARQLRASGESTNGASHQCGRLAFMGNATQRKEEDERVNQFSKLPACDEAER